MFYGRLILAASANSNGAARHLHLLPRIVKDGTRQHPLTLCIDHGGNASRN
jgi:hypothetical protein